MACALDVGLFHGLLVGGHVVDRGEMEEVVDVLVEAVDPEPLLRQVARDRHHPIARRPARDQLVEATARALADERVHGHVVALQQLFDEVAADETRCAGDEVIHASPPDTCASLKMTSAWTGCPQFPGSS